MFNRSLIVKRAACAASMLALAACGGGGGGGSSAIPTPTLADLPPGVDARAVLYNAATDRLNARSNTAFIEPFIEGMPTSGGANFVGVLYAPISTPGLTTELYGQAAISANFSAGTMSGSASDFFGTDRAGNEDAYSGSITLSAGDIAVTRPNDFTLDYGGAISGNGEAISLAGTLAGDFKADPIRGILGSDTTPNILIDGNSFGGSVNLTAEIAP